MELLYIFIAIFAYIFFVISWTTHIDMNKKENKPYNWCTFKTFIKEFDKYKNNPKLHVRKVVGETSVFLYGTNYESIVYLHASIIKFNEKCMILYPHSWLRYCIWKRKFTRSFNRQRDLWK